MKKRMDSMVTDSHAAGLTRPGIVYTVNRDALCLYAGLAGENSMVPSLRHYFDDSEGNAVIYHNRDVMDEKLASLLAESQIILYLMSDEEWREFQEYKNLVRCINEQSCQDQERNLMPKKSRDIAGTSLQSPGDPNSSAQTKAGKTHVGFIDIVTETYDEDGTA